MAPAWQILFCRKWHIFCWFSEFSFFLCVFYIVIYLTGKEILITAAHYECCSAEWSALVRWRCAANRGPSAKHIHLESWGSHTHISTHTHTQRPLVCDSWAESSISESYFYLGPHAEQNANSWPCETHTHIHTQMQKHRRTCRHTPSDTTGQAQPTTVAAAEHKQLSHTLWIIWAFQYCFR